MTTISEEVFSACLPGEWESVESQESGSLAYRQKDGPGTLVVVLLRMRPVFAIADKARLLSDYTSHRLKYERGRSPSLEQSDPVFLTSGETFEASWEAADPTAGRAHRHRAILMGDILVDFCLESSLTAEDSFDEFARSVLTTIQMIGEPGR